jgi:hypothetical protein
MKTKMFFSLLPMLVLIAAVMCSCSGGAAANVAQIDREETYPEAPVSPEKIYATFEEMKADAPLIAEVEITGTEAVMLDGFPQTYSTAKILTALKGDLKTGDIIEIVEEGGATDDGEAIVGVPVMKENAKYFLFLDVSDGRYYPVGAFQGKFIERDGYVFQQATEDIKLKDYSPKPADKFITEVKN